MNKLVKQARKQAGFRENPLSSHTLFTALIEFISSFFHIS
jgi:hypothetical protein